jgi:hypothetical protein
MVCANKFEAGVLWESTFERQLSYENRQEGDSLCESRTLFSIEFGGMVK